MSKKGKDKTKQTNLLLTPACHVKLKVIAAMSGRFRTHEPSFNQSLLLLGCFLGTLSPSSRHIRSTRL